MRAAGAPEASVAWAVFAAVAISGVTTALQSVRIGRIGGGHVLVTGSSAAFIGVCITAVAEGGPAMLATLVVISALFQILLSARLALFRRILTPTVSGTVIMLIPVTVMPFVFGLLEDVPEGSPALAAPLSALATAVVICGISLKAAGAMRLWAPVIGVVAGSLVGGVFGLYDLDRVAAAPWIGLPQAAWPGFDLDLGPTFWALVPAFLLVAMIGTIRTISSSVAVQRVSWRRRRALDFRAVQGAVNVEGIGNLMCGAAGTVPNTSYSVAASLTELTGDRGPGHGHRGGDDLRRPGVPSQGACGGAGDSGPGRHRLSDGAGGDALPDRREDRHPGRSRLPKGSRRGLRVLGRGRLPVRPGLPRAGVGVRRRSLRERDDVGRTGGHSHDPVHGAREAPAQSDGGGVRALGPAGDQGVHGRVRIARGLGAPDGGPPRSRGRGDPADDDAGRRAGAGDAPAGGCAWSRIGKTAPRCWSSSSRPARRIWRTGSR